MARGKQKLLQRVSQRKNKYTTFPADLSKRVDKTMNIEHVIGWIRQYL